MNVKGIENLRALVNGRDLTLYQKKLAQREFEELENVSVKANPIEPLVMQGVPSADVLLAKKYNELLNAVESKYANKTRHEIALKYIVEAEKGNGDTSTNRVECNHVWGSSPAVKCEKCGMLIDD